MRNGTRVLGDGEKDIDHDDEESLSSRLEILENVLHAALNRWIGDGAMPHCSLLVVLASFLHEMPSTEQFSCVPDTCCRRIFSMAVLIGRRRRQSQFVTGSIEHRGDVWNAVRCR